MPTLPLLHLTVAPSGKPPKRSNCTENSKQATCFDLGFFLQYLHMKMQGRHMRALLAKAKSS